MTSLRTSDDLSFTDGVDPYDASTAAKPFTEGELRKEGFSGFAKFKGLDFTRVPQSAGVYVLLRAKDDIPVFLDRSRGGHFKQKDPTFDPSVLTGRWVEGAHCIYIGKAGTSLRRRLQDFRHYGDGRPVGHQGGRYVWQLADADDFVVAWKTTPGEDSRAVEAALISRFEQLHGAKPLGNIIG